MALLELLLLAQQDRAVDPVVTELGRTVRDAGSLRKLFSPVPRAYPGREEAD